MIITLVLQVSETLGVEKDTVDRFLRYYHSTCSTNMNMLSYVPTC